MMLWNNDARRAAFQQRRSTINERTKREWDGEQGAWNPCAAYVLAVSPAQKLLRMGCIVNRQANEPGVQQ